MSDRELLELAAKAAGYEGVVTEYPSGYVEMGLTNYFDRHGSNVWHPLSNEGQALHLSILLRLDISHQPDSKVEVTNQYEAEEDIRWAWEPYGDDPQAATRRAIVRTAAAIGKAKP